MENLKIESCQERLLMMLNLHMFNPFGITFILKSNLPISCITKM